MYVRAFSGALLLCVTGVLVPRPGTGEEAAERATPQELGPWIGDFARMGEQAFSVIAWDLRALRETPGGSECPEPLIDVLTAFNAGTRAKYEKVLDPVVDLDRVTIVVYDQAQDWPGAGEWILFGKLDQEQIGSDLLDAGLREYGKEDLPEGSWTSGARHIGEPLAENSLKVVLAEAFVVLGNDAFTWYRAYTEKHVASSASRWARVLERVREGEVMAAAAGGVVSKNGADKAVEVVLGGAFAEGAHSLNVDVRIPPEVLAPREREWIPAVSGSIRFDVESEQLYRWLSCPVHIRGNVSIHARERGQLALDATVSLPDATRFPELLRTLRALIVASSSTMRVSDTDVTYLRAFLRAPMLRDEALRRLAETGDPNTQGELLRELKNPEADDRRWAATALGTLGTASAIPELEQLAGDASEPVREAARKAIEAIRARAETPRNARTDDEE